MTQEVGGPRSPKPPATPSPGTVPVAGRRSSLVRCNVATSPSPSHPPPAVSSTAAAPNRPLDGSRTEAGRQARHDARLLPPLCLLRPPARDGRRDDRSRTTTRARWSGRSREPRGCLWTVQSPQGRPAPARVFRSAPLGRPELSFLRPRGTPRTEAQRAAGSEPGHGGVTTGERGCGVPGPGEARKSQAAPPGFPGT